MSDSYDLKRALKLVADVERAPSEPFDDLARVQAAARSRTRRRVRLGLGALAVTSVMGVGAGLIVSGDPTPPDAPATGDTSPGATSGSTIVSTTGVQLVAETFDAAPYTFDLTPQGWSVQGQNAFGVTIAPDDGSTSDHPDDFEGKLVIMFEANPPGGRAVDVDGRQFWITGDSGYTTISTRTLAGEPAGAVRIQYPDNAGWDEESMLAFTASVHVGDGAKHGQG